MKGNEEKKKQHVRMTAEELNRYKFRRRLFTLLAAALAIAFVTIYAISAVYMVTGSFTVNVNKYEMVKYGLSLSEYADLSHSASVLNAQIDHSITNIAEDDIPDNVDMIDGEHCGKNYIAYTFYVQNAGSVEVSYDYEIKMSGITNGLDEAIRLKLYVDGGEPVTYAKTKTDGSGAEPGTTEFYSATTVTRGRMESFKPQAQTKFTVVIWIEGNDPECIDWLIGGKMKLDMGIAIAH